MTATNFETDGGPSGGPDGKQPVQILLVEDNPNDVELTRKALESGRILTNLTVASDGREALEYLTREADDADSTRPDIILLDLEMPKMDGKELLKELDEDPALASIPVVVLTTSEAERDVVESYELNANAYLTKPVGYDDFQEVIRQFERFWFEVVKLPTERH